MIRAVIITGTRRGIGKELKLLYSKTHFVISVNRVIDESYFDNHCESTNGEITFNSDIEDAYTWEEINRFCISKSIKIDMIFFNAGINIPDNHIASSPTTVFMKNLNTNFFSVLTAINTLGINFSCKFIYTSSMSVLFTNRDNFSYALSKNYVEILFTTLNQIYTTNQFQVLRFGRVKTDFTKDLIIESGILKKAIFKFIALEPYDCAFQISKYAATNRNLVNLPLSSYLIYLFLKFLISPFRGFNTSKKNYGRI